MHVKTTTEKKTLLFLSLTVSYYCRMSRPIENYSDMHIYERVNKKKKAEQKYEPAKNSRRLISSSAVRNGIKLASVC